MTSTKRAVKSWIKLPSQYDGAGGGVGATELLLEINAIVRYL